VGSSVLEDGDRRDIGECLSDLDVGWPHLARTGAEQVEGAPAWSSSRADRPRLGPVPV
jgi:hypothetical protein